MQNLNSYECFYTPKGFLTSSIFCKIGKKNDKDTMLIFSEKDCVCAGVFTKNKFQAACVTLNKRFMSETSFSARGIFVNSGNANACTGEKGLADAEKICDVISDKFNINKNEVLICSTGVIGVFLPMEKILGKIDDLAGGLSSINEAWLDSAKAIMTTDTVPKISSVRVIIDGKEVNILAMAKGAGMIAPNMATMLGFIVTDAKISQNALANALKDCVDKSFNCITVDGDSSTNDTVLCMANGMAGNSEIQIGSGDYDIFKDALENLCMDTARQIAKDGEGATKLIEVEVKNARSRDDAVKCAKAIANSPLVKTAMFGCDPNWGRIMCAVGYSGAEFDPSKAELEINSILLFKNEMPTDYDEKEVSQSLKADEIRIVVNLNDGSESIKYWTCDFSYDYVKINAEYRT